MNKIVLIGNIVRDLELIKTKNDKSVVKFSLAVRRDNEKTDFMDCIVFGVNAENLVKYQTKGSKISIIGEYRIDKYERQDGSKGYSHYIFVNEIEYLTFKTKDEIKENFESSMKINDVWSKAQDIEISEEELPFY